MHRDSRPASGADQSVPLRSAAGPAVRTVWSGFADLILAASLGSMLLWTVFTAWRENSDLSATLAYGAAPLLLAVGAVAGRLCARRDLEALACAGATAFAVAVVVVAPVYANAEAAAGVLLVAMSGLLLTGAVDVRRGARARRGTVLLASLAGVLGVLLAARSQAASILVIVVVVLIAHALRSADVPSRSLVRGVGLGSVGAAALVVLILGALSQWPGWLSQGESLSWARHRLWGEALALWRAHPVLGGGLGAFFEYSDTARSVPHLYAAHSSILQVAAELGGVGVLLFLAILVSGTVVASRGDRARGLIGVAAWCALAVHSMIDHLYEFPIVVLLAGLVIGWSGWRSGSGTAVMEQPRDHEKRALPHPRDDAA